MFYEHRRRSPHLTWIHYRILNYPNPNHLSRNLPIPIPGLYPDRRSFYWFWWTHRHATLRVWNTGFDFVPESYDLNVSVDSNENVDSNESVDSN